MKIKNCCKGLLVIAVVSFAYSADTTPKSVTSQPTVIGTIKNDNGSTGLKKQHEVVRPTTNWSKIKTLFM